MFEPNPKTAAPASTPNQASAPNGPIESVEALEALFAEVNGLAIRLKQPAASGNGRDTLPAGERSVLQILDRHGSQTVPQIARLRFTSRQNIQVLVNSLVAQGCVELTSNPAHKRSALVCLAQPGRASLRAMAGGQAQFLAGLLAEISETEALSATNLLRQIRELLTEDRVFQKPGLEPAAAVQADKLQVPTRRRKLAAAGPLTRPTPAPADENLPDDNSLPVSLL